MRTTVKKDIRKEVKEYIDHADDRMVKIIHAMLEADQDQDWWDEISDEQRASIDRGLRQLEQGKGVPHEELVKQYPKWFRK